LWPVADLIAHILAHPLSDCKWHIVLGQLLEMPAPKRSSMVNGVQAGITVSNGRYEDGLKIGLSSLWLVILFSSLRVSASLNGGRR